MVLIMNYELLHRNESFFLIFRMAKEHVKLTPEHHLYLTELLSKGTLAVKTMKRATALLELHQGKTFGAVAKTLTVDYQTVSAWAAKYKTQELGFLTDKPRSGRPLEIDGPQQAKLTALACSTPPEGRSQWSLRLLASKAVELEYCTHLSHNQAGVILKKTNLNPILNASGALER
jgi:putative transposase